MARFFRDEATALCPLAGTPVRVTVGGGSVRVLHAGHEVAVHAELKGRYGR